MGISITVGLMWLLFSFLFVFFTRVLTDWSKLIYSICGLIICPSCRTALTFFVYSLSHRFGIGKYVKMVIKASTKVLLFYSRYLFVSTGSLFGGLAAGLSGSALANLFQR